MLRMLKKSYLKRTGTLVVIALMVCLLSATSSPALVLRPLKFQELMTRASVICTAKVQDVKSFWHEGKILSWVSLVPSETFKGEVGDVLSLLVPGGEVGSVAQMIPGGPLFRTNETGLYFLEALESGEGYRLVGFSQGQLLSTETITSSPFQTYLNRLRSTLSQERHQAPAANGVLRK